MGARGEEPLMRCRRLAVTCLAMFACAVSARAQTPDLIHLVVPLAPGGPIDVQARMLARAISDHDGPTVVVENRAGGGTSIGAAYVSRARSDGATLLATGPAFLTGAFFHDVGFDPLTGFDPVCQAASSSYTLAVAGASPYRTLADFLAAAKSRPGAMTVGASGPATVQHMSVEMLNRTAGVRLTFVPYGGDAPAIVGVMGNQLDGVVTNPVAIRGQIDSGALRPLVVTGGKRATTLPEIPTASELGYNFELASFLGVFAPAGLSPATRDAVTGIVAKALRTPEFRGFVEEGGGFVPDNCGVDFAAWLRTQNEVYGRVIREAGIRAE